MLRFLRKLFLLLLISVSILLALGIGHRHLITDASDPYKCNAIQTDGVWMGKHIGPYESDHFLHWQPPGCELHEYNSREIESCLQGKRFLFVGDSTLRQIFWATARKLHNRRAAEESFSAARHHDLHFEQGCVQLDFWWDPFLNSTTLKSELQHSKLPSDSSNATRAAAILVGTGLWHAKDLDKSYLDEFKRSIDSVAQFLPHNARNAAGVLVPPVVRDSGQELVLFAPVSVPHESKLDEIRAVKLAPEKTRAMNDYLAIAAKRDNFDVLWSHGLMTWQRDSAYEEGGIHVVKNLADRQADIFLNVVCNSMPTLDHYPFDKTCCTTQPFVNHEQRLLILVAALTTVIALYKSLGPQVGEHPGRRRSPNTTAIKAAGTIAIALLYCFVADRTPIFDRLQKVPNQQEFLLLILVAVAGGLFTIERTGNRSTQPASKLSKISPGQTFLSREQTAEWKGWMQFIILAYHYTGMSRVLWVYQLIRLMVASYLFMTGYGHAVYFLKTNQFSLSRVAAVLFRLNLFSCLLAYLMRTDYNFYYFPGLSSFWFLVVYVTTWINHRPNVVPRVFVLKVLVSALIVRYLVQTPGYVELLGTALAKTCNMHLDVHEVRFRLSLDMYIVYVGMLAGAFTLQYTGGLPCSTTCLATQVKKIPTIARVSTIVTSVITLPVYIIVMQRFNDKYQYNHWHPIISPLPVLAFVVLRNASQGLRNFHCRLFEWLGRVSLETFILQYHIWLAADTKALLSLGLWTRNMSGSWTDRLGRACDFAVVTGLFLWTGWAVSNATNILTLSFVGTHQSSERASLLKYADGREWNVSNKVEEKSNGSDLAHDNPSALNLPQADNREAEPARILTRPSEKRRHWLILRIGVVLLLLWMGNRQFYL